MLTEFAGRKVILTTLDPIPPLFRSVPGHLVVNQVEAAALATGDGTTFKRLLAICSQEDMVDLHRMYSEKPHKHRRRRYP